MQPHMHGSSSRSGQRGTCSDPGPTRSRITLAGVAGLPVGETLHDTELTGFSIRRQGKAAVYSVRGTLKGQKRRVTIGKHGAFTHAKKRNACSASWPHHNCGFRQASSGIESTPHPGRPCRGRGKWPLCWARCHGMVPDGFNPARRVERYRHWTPRASWA